MDDLNFLQNSFDTSNKTDNPIVKETKEVKVVLVEDDLILGKTIAKYLSKVLGLSVDHFDTPQALLSSEFLSNTNSPFCLITDISFKEGPDGLTLIDILNQKGLKFVSLAITGFASIESAITATKKGVFHYLTKPFELEELGRLVKSAIHSQLGVDIDTLATNELKKTLRPRNLILGQFKVEPPTDEDIFCGMIGRSEKMKTIFERIKKVASTDSTVLISGPSGTGKELIANAIHHLSNRKDQRMVSVNCGAIPTDLLESELFGHVKGSFTGAVSDRVGRFELANNGTIFLDEIGDMPLHLQVKLLRVIQSRVLEPVGGTESIKINCRIISATHRNLEDQVKKGQFREDLYYRFNVIPINVPALKDRREDIPLLISYFLDRYVSADGSNNIEFDDKSLEFLMSYDWPGNVRELENLIERLVILRGGNTITPQDLPAKIYRHNPLATALYRNIFELPKDGVDLKKILFEIESSLIVQALTRTRGNKNRASKLLSLNRTTLIEKMKKKGINLRY